MTALRVVLDTNVLLSGLAFPSSPPGKIIMAWRSGALDVCTSHYILNGFRRVLPRLSHRHGLSEQEMDDLVDILSFQLDLIEPATTHEAALRDEYDQPVLGTLIAGVEDYEVSSLVTEDKDLLALQERYPIMAPEDFWQKHGPA